MEKIRVAAVQVEHKPGDKQYNLGRIEHFTAKAARAGARAVAFPECCISSYMYLENLDYDQLCALADEVPQSDTVSRLTELARAKISTCWPGCSK